MVSAFDSGASGLGSSPGRGHWLCSLARHLTLNAPLSTQVYSVIGYRQIVWEYLTNCGGVTSDGLASRPGGVEILLAASCSRNRDKLRQL